MKRIITLALLLFIVVSATEANGQTQPVKTPTVTDRIPKLRRTTVSWDDVVKPSTAADARELMSELPPLPSVSQIVSPTPEARETYYNKLVSIEMRIEELDDQQGCNDDELIAMREKLYNELSGKLGLTPDEMKKLEDPNLPEAERERLGMKIQNAMLGGVNPDDISAKAEKNEARLEQIEKRMNELEKKEKKGTLTAADKQEMESLQQEMMAMSQEMMQGMSGMMQGMSGMMDMANSVGNLTAGINAEVAQLEQKLSAFVDKVMVQREGEQSVVKSCEQIASEYESQLQSIYDQISAESDQAKIDVLYEQADAIMKNYRTRAAKIYLNGLQLRLDNTKKLLSEAETLYAEMADAQMIPQCVMGRMPLNIVTQCVDILNEAYTDFPQPDVLPVHRETFFKLEKDEYLLFSESGFSGNLDDFINTSTLLIAKSSGSVNEYEYYKLEKGTRIKLSGDGPFDFSVKKDGHNNSATQYGEWTSRSGKRKVVYTRDGSLTLHDGTTLYPMAVKASSDKIEFIIYDNDEITKCTYKL